MFRKLTIAGLLSICICMAEDDPGRALEDARRLAQEGDYEGALAKHVWFHENALKINSGYYGVRLSFALTYWIELGSKYPKALEKLKSIRDEKMATFARGEGTRPLFHDIESINESLGEKSATVDLFKKLEAANPKYGLDLYDIADEALLQAGEYELAKKCMGDPAKRFAMVRDTYLEGLEFDKGKEGASGGAFGRIFTAEVIRIITVLRKTGDKGTAEMIQAEALKTFNSDAIRNALKEDEI
jgi:hypothetical protein